MNCIKRIYRSVEYMAHYEDQLIAPLECYGFWQRHLFMSLAPLSFASLKAICIAHKSPFQTGFMFNIFLAEAKMSVNQDLGKSNLLQQGETFKGVHDWSYVVP